MKNITLTLAALIGVTSLLSAQTVIINSNYQNNNNTYRSNGGFEFNHEGEELGEMDRDSPRLGAFGFWSSGDLTSLSGINNNIQQTREWAHEDGNGVLAAMIGTDNGMTFGAIIDTHYTVQQDNQFSLSFDWKGAAASEGWDLGDNGDTLRVALFTSSTNALGGELTEIWSGGFTTNDHEYKTEILAGIGEVTDDIDGLNLWLAFSADAQNNEVAVLDNVQLSVSMIPEPSAYGLLVGCLALTVAIVRRW